MNMRFCVEWESREWRDGNDKICGGVEVDE